MIQYPIPTVVSIRPEVVEKWMDRFVVDLVECPSVSRTSPVARTFGPAVSEEYSLVFFAGGGGVDADAYPLVVVESDSVQVSVYYSRLSQIKRKYQSCLLPVVSSRPFFGGRSAWMWLAWALARRVSEWTRRKPY